MTKAAPFVAANAAVDPLVPVAFGGLFALSGVVERILGQNGVQADSTACTGLCATP